MAKPLPPEFVNYLRAWPGARQDILNKEVRRLYALPQVHDYFDAHPEIPSEKRDAMVRGQAANNAQTLATQKLQEARQHYGVSELTPDALRTALAQEQAQRMPTDKDIELGQKYGADTQSNYAQVGQQTADDDFQRMQTYVPFDQNQAHGTPMKQKPQAPPAMGPEGAPRPQRQARIDPVTAAMNYIRPIAASQEAQAPAPPAEATPTPPPPSAPIASGGPNDAAANP